MFSNDDFQTPKGKARKGLASVSVANGYLRLRIRIGNDRQVMSLGLPDTPIKRKHAEEKAHRINLDIVSGNFDPTLAKYKPQSVLSITEPDIMPKVMPTASDLWGQYRAYRASSLKETTKLHHDALARILDKIPPTPISDALVVKAELEKVTTIHQTKRILIQLGATAEFTGGRGLGDRPKVFVRPVRCGVGLCDSAPEPSLRDRPPAPGGALKSKSPTSARGCTELVWASDRSLVEPGF